jgi:adenosylmethionine-8-amino-7-oxononanoate aminotransferase
VDLPAITRQFVDAGVWIRPFGKLVYLMPPYIINRQDLAMLTGAVVAALAGHG